MPDELDQHVLRGVTAHYASPYQPTQIEPVNQAGFSGARIWKLTTLAGQFALRQWPTPGLERKRLLGLHQLLWHIHSQNVACVAPPVTSIAGMTLISVDKCCWQLEPWLPGAADYYASPSEARLTAALRALAEWHRAAATFDPGDKLKQWFASQPSATSPAIGERLRHIQDWHQRRLESTTQAVHEQAWPEFREVALPIISAFAKTAPRVADELRMATGIQFRLQPCLRDVWHDHILFVGDEVTGIIDPSACRSETVAGDIARLVGSLVRDDRRGWETALAAYQTVCPLSFDERVAVELFDRSGILLSGMNWVQWIALDGRIIDDRERVLARMSAILSRLQNLVG